MPLFLGSQLFPFSHLSLTWHNRCVQTERILTFVGVLPLTIAPWSLAFCGLLLLEVTCLFILPKNLVVFFHFSPCSLFETGSHCVVQAHLKLIILLPVPLKCWDYRCVPSSFPVCFFGTGGLPQGLTRQALYHFIIFLLYFSKGQLPLATTT
jgi:hypothetical protein